MKTNVAYLFTSIAPSFLYSGYDNIPTNAYIIGVDGGTNALEELWMIPDLVIGDMDSIEPDVLKMYQSKVPVITYPHDKNESDTELAIQWCVEQNFTEVIIINDMSGRVDHIQGLLQNLLYAHHKGLKARIESKSQQLYFLEKDHQLEAAPGTILSLIPFSKTVEKVTTDGLKYPLNEEDLYADQARGISNRFLANVARIRHENGDLLAIMTKQI